MESRTVAPSVDDRELTISDVRAAVNEIEKAHSSKDKEKWGSRCRFNGRLGYFAAAELEIRLASRAAAFERLNDLEEELLGVTNVPAVIGCLQSKPKSSKDKIKGDEYADL